MADETQTENPEEEGLGTTAEVEAVGACKRRVRAKVPADRVDQELDRTYRDLNKSVQLPGFRPGRIPRRLLEARFGKDLEKDVKDSLVQASFGEVIKEKALRIVGAPTFENVRFEKEEDLTYEVDLEVEPEFELPTYKGLEVGRHSVPVPDEEVEQQLEDIRRGAATLVPIDVADAGPDDVFVGKYSLSREGQRVKAPEDVSFSPSSNRIPPFDVPDLPERVKALVSAPGAPLSVEVEVPQDFPDEVLRGQKVQLEFVLDDVHRWDPPALDDAFAKSLGKDTVDDLRKEVRESLVHRARSREDRDLENRLVDQLVAATTMELPERLLGSESGRWRARREYELLVESGMSPEQVAQTLDKEGEAATEDLKRSLKSYFILERIAETEKIVATEAELDDRLSLLARYHSVPVDQLREQLRSRERLDDIRLSIRHEKVRAFLRRKARILGADGAPESPAATPSAEASPAADAGAEPAPASPPEGVAGQPPSE